jgi:hypothetical protein
VANALKAAFHNWRIQGRPAGDMNYVWNDSGRKALLSELYSSAAAHHDKELAICRELFHLHGMLSETQLVRISALAVNES